MDRFSFSNESIRLDRLKGSGVHGGIDRIPDPEEAEESQEQGNIPYPSKEWRPHYEPGRKASVEITNEIEDLFTNPEDADPDLLSEANEFLQEKYGVQYNPEYGLSVPDVEKDELIRKFGDWRSENKLEDIGRTSETGTYGLDFSKVGNVKSAQMRGNENLAERRAKYLAGEAKSRPSGAFEDESNPVYDNAFELSRVWKDQDAGVVYKFGKQPEDDTLVFVSSALKEQPSKRKNMLAIKVDDFNLALKRSDTPLEIHRPTSENDTKSMEDVFKHLKIGRNVFHGNRFVVELPKEVKEKSIQENASYNPEDNGQKSESLELHLDKKKIERLISPEEQKKIREFINAWKKAKRVGIGVKRGQVFSFGVAFDDNGVEKKTYLSEVLLRTAFGLPLYRQHPMDDPTGIRFGDKYINPETSPKTANKILKGLKLDGARLPVQAQVKITSTQF